MEKEYAPSAKDKKVSAPKPVKAPAPKTVRSENKLEENKAEIKLEAKEDAAIQQNANVEEMKELKAEEKKEIKAEEKNENKKVESKKPVISKKEEAIARGAGIEASKKHSMAICDFIKGKPIDQAIAELQQVLKFKRAIPMNGEIPHRKGKGMMSGRYPINTSKIFINILKALKGNVIVNGLDLEKTRIYYGSASWASRPQRAGGISAKRTNVILKAKEFRVKEAKK
jgi:ribosomal protein L22